MKEVDKESGIGDKARGCEREGEERDRRERERERERAIEMEWHAEAKQRVVKVAGNPSRTTSLLHST